ncbi:MAG TPA: hypothetical protein VE377_11125 [Candidatus Dormibacteraeota bacterium]|nr:hypothetical protein [Candidatus Dormibacteraeota bacterium]
MSGFCVSCGAPLTGPFCNSCGARAVPPPAQAAPPPMPVQSPVPPPVQQPAAWQPVNVPSSQAASVPLNQPPPQPTYQPVSAPVSAPPKSSGVGKILLWVGGVLLVLFMVGAAAAVYGFYWAKHKVESYASAVTGDKSDSIKVVASGNSCRLLSTSDLQQVLGVPIEKSAEIEEDSQPGCAYYTNQEAFNQLQKMAAEQAKRQADEVNARPGPKPDNLPALMKNANELEGVVKTLGMTQPSKDGRVFSFTVQHGFGADSWSGMRLTESAVPGFQEVPGVGDHAMIGAFGHAFYVQKGDALITMSMMFVPDARTRGTALGKRIIGNL